jgi:murein DD-endopeptidase MepM/ murein hydrolase activator NlpD
MLRDYFGMARYTSIQEIASGGGAPLDIPLETRGSGPIRMGRLSEMDPRRNTLPVKLRIMSSNLDTIKQLRIEQEANRQKTPNIVPVDVVDPRISSGFGWRENPFTGRREFHAGIDIIGRRGARIIAPAGGMVLNTGYDQWLGHYLVLGHTTEIQTIYGHLDEVSVEKGQSVRRGETIGLMGNTGLSTSSHLHYSVIVNRRAVDPLQFILNLKG